ncbi:hypothetical protein [Streptomyces sp. t39]|uniref:hypothetical protein n=1 Tax=Streptomyces sp. t39 TaxID=1828156 RepID=UPI0011CD8623|nr:hypothetical protein [Streptomyces sp. t39]TXS39666.1 hypothetical protein EAO77_36285 [Streptomyces sp. t39]
MTETITLPAEAVIGRHIAFSHRDDLTHIPRDQVGIITAIETDQPRCLRIRLNGSRRGLYVRPDAENLRYLDEVSPVPDLPMGRFTPTGATAGFDFAYEGVLVVQFDDDDLAALTPDPEKAAAAAATFLREVFGIDDESNVRDEIAELRPRTVAFEWQPEDAEFDWLMVDVEPTAEHAVQVHYLPTL